MASAFQIQAPKRPVNPHLSRSGPGVNGAVPAGMVAAAGVGIIAPAGMGAVPARVGTAIVAVIAAAAAAIIGTRVLAKAELVPMGQVRRNRGNAYDDGMRIGGIAGRDM